MKVSFVFLALVISLTQAADQNVLTENEELDDVFQQIQENEEPVKPKRVEDILGLSEDLLTKTIDEAKKEIHEEEEARTPRAQQNGEQSLQETHYRRGFVPELEPVRIDAMVKERTTKKLAQKLGMSVEDGARALERLESPRFGKQCRRIPRAAPNNKVPRGYRTIDGKGNNRYHPNLGRANTPFVRLLEADYGDGVSSPRKAADGKYLPNARNVSSIVFKEENRPSTKLAHMAMIWGQFIDHDITLGAQPNIDCSKTCGLSGECFGIPISPGDKAFHGMSCIQLKRDVPFCNSRKGYKREQINTVTSFIDGSAVYSNNPNKFNSLRDLNNPGFLIETPNPKRGLKNLLTRQEQGFCRSPDQFNKPCFRAGDQRVNENQGLASIHTIWNREHNRIVKKLRRINPHWGANKLFFEARKIVSAMIQHITYKEFLPALLDYRVRRRFWLNLQRYGYFPGYNPRVNPSIINSFAGAAYRFGHSTVQNDFTRAHKYYRQRNLTPIKVNRFFDQSFLYNGGIDKILRGLVKDRAQTVDRFFSKSVHEQLVRGPGDLADLPALNIQRGRDHGLPGYIKFRNPWRIRKLTGLKKATSFEHLNDTMNNNQINILKSAYSNISDIDLFVGAMFEKPHRKGVLGATFSIIVAEQFRRLRLGDRFWYENPGLFTLSQLQEIRKVSLARVICDNSDGIKRIYKRVLQRKWLVSCWNKWLRRVNLWKWKSRPITGYAVFFGKI